MTTAQRILIAGGKANEKKRLQMRLIAAKRLRRAIALFETEYIESGITAIEIMETRDWFTSLKTEEIGEYLLSAIAVIEIKMGEL